MCVEFTLSATGGGDLSRYQAIDLMEKSLDEKRRLLNGMTPREKADLPHEDYKRLIQEVRHVEAREEAQKLLLQARRAAV